MEGRPANAAYPLVSARASRPHLRARRPAPARGMEGAAATARLTLRLRCPECYRAHRGRLRRRARSARLDEALTQARLEMVALYQAVVREQHRARGDAAVAQGARARPDRRRTTSRPRRSLSDGPAGDAAVTIGSRSTGDDDDDQRRPTPMPIAFRPRLPTHGHVHGARRRGRRLLRSAPSRT